MICMGIATSWKQQVLNKQAVSTHPGMATRHDGTRAHTVMCCHQLVLCAKQCGGHAPTGTSGVWAATMQSTSRS